MLNISNRAIFIRLSINGISNIIWCTDILVYTHRQNQTLLIKSDAYVILYPMYICSGEEIIKSTSLIDTLYRGERFENGDLDSTERGASSRTGSTTHVFFPNLGFCLRFHDFS